ncbi:O-antigen/teichoic acid export membrane protein [Brevibacterium sanguinis]|uniref:O-antigen/teichoic acid export membrane protein n=2 Tax=Brevibacterium TaxID=1696 RepID=A0A366IND8_9MICO|nr:MULTISPECIES: oligosaccharide flippase family protein [Brevibacterium]RBP66969.1 O-antigen/teichoic acid export membrane protein [Brevibacterium sanguinis]RBP73494.1 O-antigen/teichoic acid export membrane protein [Brevibacterium celere]
MDAAEQPAGVRIAALVLVASQVLAAGGAVLVNLLAAVVLDPAARGDLAFALQLAYFLSVFAVMGLERPFIAARTGVFGAEYRIFARLVVPGTLVVLPVAIVATAVSPFSTDWLWMGAIAITGYVALNSLTRAVRVAYVSSRNWKRFTLNAIATQVVIIAGAGLLVLLDAGDPVLWMWVYVLSVLPAVVLLGLALRSGSLTAAPGRQETRELRRRGWVLLPSEFSNTAMLRSDRLLLPALSTSAELGLYVTVATVLEMATWPVQQWVDASLRGWSTSARSLPRMAARLIARCVLLLTVAATALGTAAYVMIVAVLPESYLPATAAILPLAVSAVVFGITRVQQGLLIAAGAPGPVSVIEIIGTVASVLAYVLLIPQHGMLGAAYGSIIGYSICAAAAAIAMLLVFRRGTDGGDQDTTSDGTAAAGDTADDGAAETSTATGYRAGG